MSDDVLILTGADVAALLAGGERAALAAVREAYLAHARGDTDLPHSTFLRFPDDARNRIIALPAYLHGETPLAGIKWIASFPDNPAAGLDRASAVMVLNSVRTGRPEVILEAAEISAVRTAASAVLAAQALHGGGTVRRVSLIGCGYINATILRFLLMAFAEIESITLFDLDHGRALSFARTCGSSGNGPRVTIAETPDAAWSDASIISCATTATTPHVEDLSSCEPGVTVLHVSLRDLSPGVILSCDNVVDDIDHVCRARTSVHLAEEEVGHRRFIRATLADVLLGHEPPRADASRPVVFSPFGLGILDLAIAAVVTRAAREQSRGTRLPFFAAPSHPIMGNPNEVHAVES